MMENAHVHKEWLVADGRKLYVESGKQPNGRYLGVLTKVSSQSNHELPKSGTLSLTSSCFKCTTKLDNGSEAITWVKNASNLNNELLYAPLM